MPEYETPTETAFSHREHSNRDAVDDVLASIVAPSTLDRYERKHYLGVSS